MSGPNGSTSAQVTDHKARVEEARDSLVTDLRQLVTIEEALHDQLKADLDESRHRRDRYRKALEQLVMETPKPKAAARPVAPVKGDWHVSDEKVAQVWETIKAQGPDATWTTTGIANLMPGVSPESVRRSVVVLRERELVRIAGKARGGGKSWAMMPEAVVLDVFGKAIDAHERLEVAA